jgi:hypothetical protein
MTKRQHTSHIFCAILPIETGRWYHISKYHRECTKCSENLIGDEFHYWFICSHPEIVNLRVRDISIYHVLLITLRTPCCMSNHYVRSNDEYTHKSNWKHYFNHVVCQITSPVFFSIFNLVHNVFIAYIDVCLYLCMYICLLMLYLVPELN